MKVAAILQLSKKLNKTKEREKNKQTGCQTFKHDNVLFVKGIEYVISYDKKIIFFFDSCFFVKHTLKANCQTIILKYNPTSKPATFQSDSTRLR